MGTRFHNSLRQQGFTLIEIMVALAISLILMIGVSQIFMGNRESYKLQSGMATMQDNARAAMDILERDISMAGFPARHKVWRETPRPFPLQATDGGGAASDTLTLQFMSELDCQGNSIVVTPGEPVLNTRIYSVGDPDADNTSSLLCQTVAGGDPVALVDGIDNIQFLYGVDTDFDAFPNKYVAQPAFPDERAVTVRLAVLVNSIEPVLREPKAETYALLDSALIPTGDSLARRVYYRTVIVRNEFGRVE